MQADAADPLDTLEARAEKENDDLADEEDADSVLCGSEGSGAASISGVLPLVWLLMGCGFAIQALALIDKATMPVPGFSTLLLSVKSTLRGELLTFMALFLIYLIIYWWTLFLVYPRHESTPIVPQAIEFGAWWSSLEAMVLLSFVGQPLDIEYNPEAWARLGTWQGIGMGGEHPEGTRSLLRPDTYIISFCSLCLLMCMPLSHDSDCNHLRASSHSPHPAFSAIYFFYMFFSVVLLLNLLIAMLSEAFAQTQQESILQGRIAFARCILRLELIADVIGLETRAGTLGTSGRYVHEFRELRNSPDDELKPDAPDENIFDQPEPTVPDWAERLMAKLDSLPGDTTDKILHEIAEGNRQRRQGVRGGSGINSSSGNGSSSSSRRQMTSSTISERGEEQAHLPPPATLPSPYSNTNGSAEHYPKAEGEHGDAHTSAKSASAEQLL